MVRLLLAFVGTLALAPAAFAQVVAPVPTPRPDAIRLVVPFPPGGGSGALAQVLAPAMGHALGIPVGVEHVAGEGGQLGMRTVAGAAPDGRTLLLGSTASLLAPGLVTRARIVDPTAEFEPVAIVAKLPRLVVVHPSLPARSLDELIRLVRSGAGVRCAYSDSLGEFASVEFARLTGTTLRCADYDGRMPGLREDLLAGRVNLAFEGAFVREVQQGALKALAVASTWRLPSLPNVPTTSEGGLPGLEAVAWLALLAPPRTPAPVVASLREAALAAIDRPEVRAVMQQRGYVVRPLSPVQTREFLAADTERWRRLLARRAQPRSGAVQDVVAAVR
jgi:tripartite-type tricarboxylate transporter receptor subunit TctC